MQVKSECRHPQSSLIPWSNFTRDRQPQLLPLNQTRMWAYSPPLSLQRLYNHAGSSNKWRATLIRPRFKIEQTKISPCLLGRSKTTTIVCSRWSPLKSSPQEIPFKGRTLISRSTMAQESALIIRSQVTTTNNINTISSNLLRAHKLTNFKWPQLWASRTSHLLYWGRSSLRMVNSTRVSTTQWERQIGQLSSTRIWRSN